MSVSTKRVQSIVNRPLADRVGVANWMAGRVAELSDMFEEVIKSPIECGNINEEDTEAFKRDWRAVLRLIDDAEEAANALRDSLLQALTAASVPAADDDKEPATPAVVAVTPTLAPQVMAPAQIGMRVHCFVHSSSGVDGTIVSFCQDAIVVRIDEAAEGEPAGSLIPCKLADVTAYIDTTGKVVSE